MTTITHFSPDAFYRPTDPKLNALAKPQTLRLWRRQRKGPSYMKIGGRVFYSGAALNEWLGSSVVELTAA